MSVILKPKAEVGSSGHSPASALSSLILGCLFIVGCQEDSITDSQSGAGLEVKSKAVSEGVKVQRSPEEAFEARARLEKLGINFSLAALIDRILVGDGLAVELFLDAGMDPNSEVDLASWLASKGGEPWISGVSVPLLLFAEELEKPDIAQILIRRGASPERLRESREAIKRKEGEMALVNKQILDAVNQRDQVMPKFMGNGESSTEASLTPETGLPPQGGWSQKNALDLGGVKPPGQPTIPGNSSMPETSPRKNADSENIGADKSAEGGSGGGARGLRDRLKGL